MSLDLYRISFLAFNLVAPGMPFVPPINQVSNLFCPEERFVPAMFSETSGPVRLAPTL